MSRKRKRARRGSAQIIITPNKYGAPTYATRITEMINGVAKRTYVTLKADTPDAADAELFEIKARIKRGLPAMVEAPVPPSSPASITVKALVEDFVTNYVADVWDIKKRRAELKCVLNMHLVPLLGDADAETIKIEDINLYKDQLLALGRSASRRKRVLTDTQLMFNWALSRGKLRRVDNPWALVDKPEAKSSTEFYRDDEVAALLDWCERHGALETHAMICFAYYTGARRGEIAAVRWSDFDWANNKLELRRSWKRDARKNGEAHTGNLAPYLVDVLKAHRARVGQLGDGYVFPSTRTDKMKRRRWMRSTNNLWGLDDARDGANAESKAKGAGDVVRTLNDPWHAFRHSSGTSLAMQGASLSHIMTALGQKSESMARRYTHMAATAVKKYVDALPVLGKVMLVPRKAVDRQMTEDGEEENLVGPEGFEPSTNGLKGRCSTG